MRRYERLWREFKKRAVGNDRPFRVRCISVFPLRFEMPRESAASCCRQWGRADGAINHARGVWHFRRWCIEHPERVASRWGDGLLEDIRLLIAEEVLCG